MSMEAVEEETLEMTSIEILEVPQLAEDKDEGASSSQNLSDFHDTLFKGIKDFYDRGVFCDLRLYATSTNSVMKWGVEEAGRLPYVACHATVLASVIPSVKNLLTICEWDPKEEAYCLYLPDVSFPTLKLFVDQLYAQLVACQNNLALDLDAKLAQVFGLSDGKDYKNCAEACIKKNIVPVNVPLTSTGEIDYDAFNKNAHFAKLAKTQYEAQVTEVLKRRENPFIKNKPPPLMNDLIHIVDGKIHLSQGPGLKHKPLSEINRFKSPIGTINQHPRPMPPSSSYEKPPPLVKEQPSLPTPALFKDEPATRYNTNYSAHRQNFRRLESAHFGFRRNMGCFHAVTQPYYTTPNIINDPDNLVPGSTPQNKRQFRMKLPKKDFVALMAVGIREGQNVATTLALKSNMDDNKNNSIPEDVTMANIIDMAKCICGTSSGVILRHPRCSLANQEKISREAIDTFKHKFKELTKGEQSNIATECQIFLKEFDTVSQRIEFHHLPSKPRKLEFILVDHIPRSEILDYALVYGDAANQFVIRSLFNFKYQTIPDIRRITIILDLIACFVGLDGAGKPLTEFGPMIEIFSTYAKRTCQNLAVQELGVLSVEKEVSADVEAVNFFADDSQFSMKTGALDSEDMARKLNISINRRGDLNNEGKFKCNIGDCNVTCVDKRRLNAHVARMHTGVGAGVEDPKACVLCGRVQRNSMELKMHWYRYHKEVKCKDCGEEFKGMSFLQAHRARLHYVLVKCDQCGEECKGTGRLKIHKINKHLEDHQKPFVCSFCGKGYAEKVKLKAHQMNVHIRSRPYKCRIEGCKADFNCLANRNAHEKSVHKYDYKSLVTETSRHPPNYLNRKEPSKRSRRAKKRQADEDEEAANAISQLM